MFKKHIELRNGNFEIQMYEERKNIFKTTYFEIIYAPEFPNSEFFHQIKQEFVETTSPQLECNKLLQKFITDMIGE